MKPRYSKENKIKYCHDSFFLFCSKWNQTQALLNAMQALSTSPDIIVLFKIMQIYTVFK